MKDDRGAGMAWWSAVTILTSAFLLFQVQPIISKTILPWFGGSPAVWTTCVLFFQVLLLGGYSYAHVLTKYLSPLQQGRIHAALLAIAVMTLPIVPSEFWKPLDGEMPALRILVLLAAKVGAPYFLLSSSGPLVQSWFFYIYPGRSPYRLYALSNIGSLTALLSYPFIFEPAFAVNAQGWLWSIAFAVFALLAGGLGIMVWRIASEMEIAEARNSTEPTSAKSAVAAKVPSDVPETGDAPPWYLQAHWIFLTALASMSLLAITNYVCQDIAVSPFMWVIPLSLYLLSFIICFDREIWYWRPFWGMFAVVMIGLLCALDNYHQVDNSVSWVQELIWLKGVKLGWGTWAIEFPIKFSGFMDVLFGWLDVVLRPLMPLVNRLLGTEWDEPKFKTAEFGENLKMQATFYMAVLFAACMVFHGELVKSKPAVRYLTKYYLMLSAGGALGGIFVGLICPLIFPKPFELTISIVASFVVGCVALLNAGKSTRLGRKELLQWSSAFVVVGLVFLVGAAQLAGLDTNTGSILHSRNFYGTIWVKEIKDTDEEGADISRRSLYHGRILHGTQYTSDDRADEATTYYDDAAGPGIAVRDYPGRRDGKPMRVAVVGLGTGTMAAHARNGDYYCFYDIDPKVVALHEQLFTIDKKPQHVFTFIDRARARGATVDITLGDARVQMEREAKNTASPKEYDVLVLDAFSGDAIPAHLLTVEALEVYDKQMRHVNGKNVGILAIHISNRYLDLEPVVNALAKKFEYQQVPVHYDGSSDAVGDTSSDWILLTRNEEFLGELTTQAYIIAKENERAKEDEEDRQAIADGKKPKKRVREVLWTDQRSDLFSILK
ncbi:MAG: hypothetical protein ACKVP0_01080 [Pirellulaceae bacterium]